MWAQKGMSKGGHYNAIYNTKKPPKQTNKKTGGKSMNING